MRYTRIIVPAMACMLSMATFSSCKKDSIDKVVDNCRINKMEVGGTTDIEYGSDGRISKISRSIGFIQTYEYSGNTVTISVTSDGLFAHKKIVTLNSDGLATNVKIEQNEAGTEWINTAYEYNGTELRKATETSTLIPPPDVTTYTWSGGNLISSSDGFSAEYYLDKPSQQGDYYYAHQIEKGYFVIKTKNLMKKEIYPSLVTDISYERDEDGKITKLTETFDGSRVAYRYQYECNF